MLPSPSSLSCLPDRRGGLIHTTAVRRRFHTCGGRVRSVFSHGVPIALFTNLRDTTVVTHAYSVPWPWCSCCFMMPSHYLKCQNQKLPLVWTSSIIPAYGGSLCLLYAVEADTRLA